jgi:hypothetical protein
MVMNGIELRFSLEESHANDLRFLFVNMELHSQWGIRALAVQHMLGDHL